jgi:predicted phosphoadenosine phosphosulfate sulfurtransferase
MLLKNSSILCLYFLTLPLVGKCALSIHQKEQWKCWGARYTLGARYLLTNTVIVFMGHVYTKQEDIQTVRLEEESQSNLLMI